MADEMATDMASSGRVEETTEGHARFMMPLFCSAMAATVSPSRSCGRSQRGGGGRRRREEEDSARRRRRREVQQQHLMVQPDAGDDAYFHLLAHVGGVQSTPHPNLDQRIVHLPLC